MTIEIAAGLLNSDDYADLNAYELSDLLYDGVADIDA